MASRAKIVRFGSLPTYRFSVDTYDSTKLGLGPLMVQKNGVQPEDKYVGPIPTTVARPMEQSVAIPSVFPWAMQWKNNTDGEIDWIFLADNLAAAATRRINFYEFNRRTGDWGWNGFITITFPTTGTYIIRALRMTYDLVNTGTVTVSGTTVTGAGTSWLTNKACVGNRIGFGSIDPTQISTWYNISAMASDTSITLASTAGTFPAGTAFVIEDLRAVLATTASVTTNGGLYVVKGLAKDLFSNVGGTVPAATTVDNIKACYWLADAATVTNLISCGMGIEPKTSSTSQMVYVIDTTTNPVIFKYNIRAALTLTAGKDTTSFQFKTGSGGAVTGAIGQNNNGRYAIVSHGPHNGIPCLYFTTVTRVYAAPISGISSGSTLWLSGGTNMTEVPPGGVSTFAAGALMASIEYMSTIDKFVITQNATTAPMRSYVTQYRTDGGQFDRLWGNDTRQIDQGLADSTITPLPSMTGGPYTIWCEAGLAYIATFGITAIINRLYATPLGADWEYVDLTNARIVTPKITCENITKYFNAFASQIQIIGGGTAKNLGSNSEPFRIKYRTSGIDDNSGAWTLLDDTGDMTGVDGSTDVQFSIGFRTIGTLCIPTRVANIAIVYEDNTTDSHYQPSVGQSSTTSKYFSWRFSDAWGSTVPTLRVRLYNAVTGGLLVDDNSATPTGTWGKSTNDGSSWEAYNTTDKTNETTYIRYTPATLGDNIKVRALLTLN